MKKTGVEWNAVTYGAYNKVEIDLFNGKNVLPVVFTLGCL